MNMRNRFFLAGLLSALLTASTAIAQQSDPAARVAAVRERLAAIEQRSTRVADINEIENLQRIYGYYTDKMLWDHVVDLFAEDGTMEIGESGVYVGKESIRRYLYSLTDGEQGPFEGVLYNHLQLQPIITLADDGLTAEGRWRAFLLTGVHGSGSGGNWGEGPYENEYVKEGGVWKISKLHWFATFIAPYEGGWLDVDDDAVAEYSAGKGVEPDRPSSTNHEPYPAADIVPFHYPNPVTGPRTPANRGATAAEETTSGADPELAATIAELETALAAAELKVERLEDVDALENLASAYGLYVDKSMQDDIADLFTADGVVEILGRGVYLGQDRVREYMHNLGPVGPQEGALFNHMHLQPVIHVSEDGQTANVRSRLFVQFGILDTNAQWGAGVYENALVKEDGIWKFDYLHAYQTFYTNYEDGWAKRSSGIFAPYDRLPPDLPQSVPYDPYPAAFVPPFHYANPVTGRTDHYAPAEWMGPRAPAR